MAVKCGKSTKCAETGMTGVLYFVHLLDNVWALCKVRWSSFWKNLDDYQVKVFVCLAIGTLCLDFQQLLPFTYAELESQEASIASSATPQNINHQHPASNVCAAVGMLEQNNAVPMQVQSADHAETVCPVPEFPALAWDFAAIPYVIALLSWHTQIQSKIYGLISSFLVLFCTATSHFFIVVPFEDKFRLVPSLACSPLACFIASVHAERSLKCSQEVWTCCASPLSSLSMQFCFHYWLCCCLFTNPVLSLSPPVVVNIILWIGNMKGLSSGSALTIELLAVAKLFLKTAISIFFFQQFCLVLNVIVKLVG